MSPDDQRSLWDSYAGTDLAPAFVSGSPTSEEASAVASKSADKLVRTLGITESDTVVDIGPGLCFHGIHLAQRCKLWIGVDVAGALMQSALPRRCDIPNMITIVNNGYDLADIGDRSVSVIYSMAVFLHLEEWQRYSYIQESFRVLVPGGRFYVESLSIESDEGWELFDNITRLFREEPSSRLQIRPSTMAELNQYLERCGFESIRCSLDGPRVIAYASKS